MRKTTSHFWTSEDLEYLKASPHMTHKQVATVIGCTAKAVARKRTTMGYKSEAWRAGSNKAKFVMDQIRRSLQEKV